MEPMNIISIVSRLVDTRETVVRDGTRRLAVQSDGFGDGFVGDDDLSAYLEGLSGDIGRVAELNPEDLRRLLEAFRGDSVDCYVNASKPDQLEWLDALIAAAWKI